VLRAQQRQRFYCALYSLIINSRQLRIRRHNSNTMMQIHSKICVLRYCFSTDNYLLIDYSSVLWFSLQYQTLFLRKPVISGIGRRHGIIRKRFLKIPQVLQINFAQLGTRQHVNHWTHASVEEVGKRVPGAPVGQLKQGFLSHQCYR